VDGTQEQLLAGEIDQLLSSVRAFHKQTHSPFSKDWAVRYLDEGTLNRSHRPVDLSDRTGCCACESCFGGALPRRHLATTSEPWSRRLPLPVLLRCLADSFLARRAVGLSPPLMRMEVAEGPIEKNGH